MAKFFLERVKGGWVLAWFAAALLWFIAAFQLTGVWPRFGELQGEATPLWLDTTPFFSVELATAVIARIHAASGEGLAYTAYLVDLPFMLLHASALAALIAFAARRARLPTKLASLLFFLPMLRLLGDVVENAGLAAAIAAAQPHDTLLLVASGAGGIKFVAAAISMVVGVALLVWAFFAWLFGKARRKD